MASKASSFLNKNYKHNFNDFSKLAGYGIPNISNPGRTLLSHQNGREDTANGKQTEKIYRIFRRTTSLRTGLFIE